MPKPDIEVSIWIARPPEDIWNYLCDVSNEVLWRYGIYLAQWISDPPYGVGSTGFHFVSIWGDCPWSVTESEEPRIISWEFTGGRLEGSRAGYRVTPEGAGSRVTFHMSVKPSALWRIMIFLMKWPVRHQIAGDLERLKAIMEA